MAGTQSIYKSLLIVHFFLITSCSLLAQNNSRVEISDKKLSVKWHITKDGYKISSIDLYGKSMPALDLDTDGEYTVLYSASKPDTAAQPLKDGKGNSIIFPEPEYRYVVGKWRESTDSVSLNTAGTAYHFYPEKFEKRGDSIIFSKVNGEFSIQSSWKIDGNSDLRVCVIVKVFREGYFSVATPSLVKEKTSDFQWAVVPGVWQGKAVNPDFVNAFAYGQGIPAIPVLAKERTAAALTSILTNKQGISLAVTAEPGTGRDPWADNKVSQGEWLLGLSSMNRKGELTPTLYHPVLGGKKSYLKAGDSLVFNFRYTIQNDHWYSVYKHVVNNIYKFPDFLSLKKTKESLSARLLRLYNYVINDSTSRWRNFEYKGLLIGAQEYLGGVHDSEKDAIKNADYGAMWMLSNLTDDSILMSSRLPQALDFKYAQQNTSDSFLRGAAAGQYYLHKSKRFTEEWGPYTEPIATTYYMLLDIGNILLFEPNHPQLKNELILAADWLLNKMKSDGSWEIAYDNTTYQPLFTDQLDYRPTFYGLLVAYRLTGDKKYLDGAVKGAGWFIDNAVSNAYFLGVCGDTRFAPDFATGQSVQALLDLYDCTKNEKYKKAALTVAQIYTTSVYTHPIPSEKKKMVENRVVYDWEISQVGLSFEHGGIIGSANSHGPILLSSHAGMFVRLFQITNDSLFLNMARAAAWARDAFVDPATGVASYYWNAMNKGAGPFPHHAWWQIGWITDYLIAETYLRSAGKIDFPAGFITPKVGPHKTYGFAEGKLYGKKVKIKMIPDLIHLSDESVDYITAIDATENTTYFVLLNNSVNTLETTFNINPDQLKRILNSSSKKLKTSYLNESGKEKSLGALYESKIVLPPSGILTIKVKAG
jgi:hypothetical protein